MAERVSIKGGDLDGSLLENAASEATLVLLKEAMEKLAKQSGASTSSANRGLRDLRDASEDTAEEVDDLGSSLSVLTTSVAVVGKAFMGVFKIIGGLGTAVGSGITAFSQFTEMMITSPPTITDFTGAIEDSRLNILGLGTAVNVLTKLVYGNYTTFQDLSKSGIQLGGMVGSLTEMYAGSGQSLEGMAASLAANSEQLAMLGTASKGARTAMILNQRAFNNNKNVLAAWGMSFSEQGEIFTEFLAQNAIALRRRTITESDVTNMSQGYAINLRKLSELTGKQVDEIQGELEKANLHKGFEAFIAGIDDPALQDKYKRLIEEYGATFGDSGRELAMATIMGVSPLTEGSQKMAAVMPDIQSALESQKQSAQTFAGSTDEFMGTVREQNHNLAISLQSWIDENAQLAAILSMKGSPIGDAFNAIINGLNIYSGDIDSLGGKLDPAAEAILTFDTATQGVRDSLSKMVTSFFGNEAVMSGLDKFGQWVEYYTPIITTELENFATWLQGFDPTLYNPFDEQGRQNIYDAFWDAMKTVGETISGWWNSETGLALRNNIADFFEGLVRTIEDMFVNSTTLNTLLGIDREEVANRQATTGGNIDVENALTAALGKGFWNVSEVAGVESVGGKETYDKLMQHLGDSADDYWTMNGRIEAALESLGAKYEAGTATEEERQLFAKTIANLTDPNKAPIAYRPGNPAVPAPDINRRQIGTYRSTGLPAEPNNAITQIHQGERVLNPQETQVYNNLNNIQSQLVKKVEELNTSMLKAVDLLQDSVNVARQTTRSIKSLGTDAMRGVGR
jgi:hypothetical protein